MVRSSPCACAENPTEAAFVSPPAPARDQGRASEVTDVTLHQREAADRRFALAPCRLAITRRKNRITDALPGRGVECIVRDALKQQMANEVKTEHPSDSTRPMSLARYGGRSWSSYRNRLQSPAPDSRVSKFLCRKHAVLRLQIAITAGPVSDCIGAGCHAEQLATSSQPDRMACLYSPGLPALSGGLPPRPSMDAGSGSSYAHSAGKPA